MFSSFIKKTASIKLMQDEEMKLLKEYQQTGDLKALKKLKISLRPLIRNVASRAMPSSNEISISQIIIRADGHIPSLLKKYNPSEGQLNTFLTNQLTYLLKNAVSENKIGPHVPRPEHDNLFQFQQAKRNAVAEYGKDPTSEQILQFDPRLKSVEEIDRIKQYNNQSLVGDAQFGGSDEDDSVVAFKDLFNTQTVDPNDRLRSLQMDQLRQLMDQLDPQERKIIEDYVFNEKSMMDVALSLGLSSSQVRKTVTRWRGLVKEKGYDKL